MLTLAHTGRVRRHRLRARLTGLTLRRRHTVLVPHQHSIPVLPHHLRGLLAVVLPGGLVGHLPKKSEVPIRSAVI
jgi:hypothetical protein